MFFYKLLNFFTMTEFWDKLAEKSGKVLAAFLEGLPLVRATRDFWDYSWNEHNWALASRLMPPASASWHSSFQFRSGQGLLIQVPDWFRHRHFFSFWYQPHRCRTVWHSGILRNYMKGGRSVRVSVAQKVQFSSVGCSTAQKGAAQLSRMQHIAQ